MPRASVYVCCCLFVGGLRLAACDLRLVQKEENKNKPLAPCSMFGSPLVRQL